MKSPEEWASLIWEAELEIKPTKQEWKQVVASIQADALRHAAEIANVPGSCLRCQDTFLNITAEADRIDPPLTVHRQKHRPTHETLLRRR